MAVYRNRTVLGFLFLTFIFTAAVSGGYGQSKCLTDEEVKKIVENIKSQQNAALNKKLQLELFQIKQDTAQIYEELSRLTSQSKTLEERLTRKQEANTTYLCQILKEHGWTTKALVGAEAAEIAATIFTDSPSLEFQQLLLPVVQAAFEAGEIPKSSYAKIVDQLRVRTGKKQVFGTLVGISKDLLLLYPIENESKLAELRREYELPPLAAQIRRLEQKYQAVVVKPPASATTTTQQNQEEIKTAVKASDGEKEDVLRVETSLVNLNVTALPDKPGAIVPPLNKEDFTILENGREQTIDWFAATQVPFDITLLIDISGSTSNKIKLIRKTTRNFIKAARPADRISIVVFDEEITVVSPLTEDRKKLLDSVEKIKSRGGSKIWDALAFALQQDAEIQNLNQQNRRRSAIVFMTDGEDNTFIEQNNIEPSKNLFADLLEKARHSPALIVPIHLDTRDSYGMTEKLYAGTRRALNLLADESGGLFYEAEDIDDLEGIYPQVINDLSKVYSIGYSPSNASNDGGWRSVKVNIKKYPNLTIRARKGYYAQ